MCYYEKKTKKVNVTIKRKEWFEPLGYTVKNHNNQYVRRYIEVSQKVWWNKRGLLIYYDGIFKTRFKLVSMPSWKMRMKLNLKCGYIVLKI